MATNSSQGKTVDVTG